MTSAVYVAFCVLAPAAWGGLMYVVFGWVRRRTTRDRGRDDLPPADYTI
jgi:hypothetical protein